MRQRTTTFGLALLLMAAAPGCAEKSSTGGVPCPGGNCSEAESAEGDSTAEDSEMHSDTERSDVSPSTEDVVSDDSMDEGTSEGSVEDASTGEDVSENGESLEVDATPSPVDVVDVDGPEITSMSPADGESNVSLPLEVVIQFNEPIREETVDSSTFELFDWNGNKLEGSPVLSEDKTRVILTPNENSIQFSSPYQIRIGAFVQDTLGNAIGEDLEFTFYTGAPENLGTYAALAEEYAPLIRQSVRTGKTQYDYPTELNFDGEWLAENNPASIKNVTEVKPVVYWDAVETRSHLFLFYFLYYPTKEAPGVIPSPVASDLTGMVVTLFTGDPEQAPEPVSVLTYGGLGGIEDMRVFRAEDSALGEGNLVDATAPWDVLASENRFTAWVTQPTHITCSWAVPAEGECELNEGILLELNWITMGWSLEGPTLLLKEGGWPMEGDAWEYELQHSLPTFWARRSSFDAEGLWASNTFDYTPSGAPEGGDVFELPSFFAAPEGSDSGRPPWAWKWKAGGFSQFTDLPRGTLYLDPAYFFLKRHGLENSPWESETKTGWSEQYCFNGALNIDKRETFGDCLPVQIP